MKRWGVVITAFYAVVVAILFVPALLGLANQSPTASAILKESWEVYHHWLTWLWLGILVAGQSLLLFLSVDTSWKRLKPRQHVAITGALASFLAALLTFAAIWSLAVGIFGEKADQLPLAPFDVDQTTTLLKIAAWWVGLWTMWGVVFYLYQRGSVKPVSLVVSWLLKGSVLELLIAVPAHIIVRHRNECSAPIVTGWGIVTGIAVMLLCFGPGVLALYKKKLDAYSRKRGQRAEG